MPPPPRRRRPVQPATRVRLPRAARPRGTSAADLPDDGTLDLESPQTAAPDTAAPGNGAPGDGPPGRGTPGTQVTGNDQTAGNDQAAGDDLAAADELVTEEPAAGDRLAADEPDGPGGDSLAADEPAAGWAGGQQDGQQDAPAAGPQAAARRRSPLLVPGCLGVLAVVLGGLAVWFSQEAGSATSGVDTANVALTHPAATSQVSRQVASAVNTIFSYNYADTAKTSRAAASLLTGGARKQYDTLFKLVRQDAPAEKLVVTTTVTNSGVEYLIGNQARLLIFANQRSTAGAAHKTTEAGAMFAVNAVNQGGRWRIAHIDTFGQSG